MPRSHRCGKTLAKPRRCLSHGDQRLVPVEHDRVVASGELVPAQSRSGECLERPRIRHLTRRPAELAELSAPPGADSLLQLGITEVREVLERRARRPFLALKDQGNERREDRNGGSDARATGAHDVREAVAGRAIADLVVVLRVAEKAGEGKLPPRPAEAAPAEP